MTGYQIKLVLRPELVVRSIVLIQNVKSAIVLWVLGQSLVKKRRTNARQVIQASLFCNSCITIALTCQPETKTRSSATAEIARDADVGAHRA